MRSWERDARAAAVYEFGGLRIDAAVVRELIHAVEPMAIEEALLAERRHMESQRRTTDAFLNWSCNRPATKPRLLNGATPLVTRIIA